MKRGRFFYVLGILLVVLCMQLTNAEYDMTQESDWKWAYAFDHPDADLLKYNINDKDIDYGRMKVNASKEDCGEMGGQWCTWHEEDKATLERMIKAKTNLPAIPENNSKSAWQKITDFLRNLFGF